MAEPRAAVTQLERKEWAAVQALPPSWWGPGEPEPRTFPLRGQRANVAPFSLAGISGRWARG